MGYRFFDQHQLVKNEKIVKTFHIEKIFQCFEEHPYYNKIDDGSLLRISSDQSQSRACIAVGSGTIDIKDIFAEITHRKAKANICHVYDEADGLIKLDPNVSKTPDSKADSTLLKWNAKRGAFPFVTRENPITKIKDSFCKEDAKRFEHEIWLKYPGIPKDFTAVFIKTYPLSRYLLQLSKLTTIEYFFIENDKKKFVTPSSIEVLFGNKSQPVTLSNCIELTHDKTLFIRDSNEQNAVPVEITLSNTACQKVDSCYHCYCENERLRAIGLRQ